MEKKHRTLVDNEHGNKALFFELGPKDSGKIVEIRYRVQRIEKSAYPSHALDIAKHLNAERLVPDDDVFMNIAKKVVEGKKGDLVRARALYDHVIERMRYMRYGTGWGKGDAVYACTARIGNCSDYHAYFIAIAMAAGIPARFGRRLAAMRKARKLPIPFCKIRRHNSRKCKERPCSGNFHILIRRCDHSHVNQPLDKMFCLLYTSCIVNFV